MKLILDWFNFFNKCSIQKALLVALEDVIYSASIKN